LTAQRRVEILARQRRHDGFIPLDILELRHERFDGGTTPLLRRELWGQRPAVAVLPYDPASERVVLVEQFRVGALGAGADPWLLEAPAGLIEPGEAPEAVARRELHEECGLTAGRLEPIAGFFSSPGSTSEFVHCFLAECAIPAGSWTGGVPGEHEDILSHALSLEDALRLLAEGRVRAITSVLTLIWLRGERARIRAAWAPPGRAQA
jgi:ADP-ribose pyrophosphatase